MTTPSNSDMIEETNPVLTVAPISVRPIRAAENGGRKSASAMILWDSFL